MSASRHRRSRRSIARCERTGASPGRSGASFQGSEAHIPERYRYVIVLGVGQDPRLIALSPALPAGLGELGKHGSLITRPYGPSIRFAWVAVEEMISVPIARPARPPAPSTPSAHSSSSCAARPATDWREPTSDWRSPLPAAG